MSQAEDKLNAHAYGWKRLATDYPYTNSRFRVRQDQVQWPDGHVAPYVYIQAPGAVWVVPMTPDRKIVLIRQFRYAVDDWCWEVPAGGFHDFTGNPLELAQRELAEEVGGVSDDWTYVGTFRRGVSTVDEVCYITLARNVQFALEPNREPGEIIEVHLVNPDHALAMARNGEIIDALSALALLRCEPFL